MQRVLDIDLDFFFSPVVHRPPDHRPDPGRHTIWPVAAAMTFLQDRCLLPGPTPGFLTEVHSDLYYKWREAIEHGLLRPPFHVTHVDAHADLGQGNAGYVYVMTSLLFQDPEARSYPNPVGCTGITEGNFLLFALAPRWISGLDYVFDSGGGDELFYAMEGFDRKAAHIQLAAMRKSHLDQLRARLRTGSLEARFEPKGALPALSRA